MKKLLSLCCLLLFLLPSFGQTREGKFVAFDKNGDPTSNLDKAAFMMHISKVNDTTFTMRYYHFKGPMISQESYRDSALTIPNGRFCWYNSKGELDSTGNVVNGKKDGYWEYVLNRQQTRAVTYSLGKIIKEEMHRYDAKGKPVTDNKKTDDEDTAEHKYVKANFESDINHWVMYCQENLHTPQRLQDVLGLGTHTCMVVFLVNKEGKTNDIYLSHSVEWSGDAEVMRLIADSPRWEPATVDGKPVVYRQRQSLSFAVVAN